MGMPHFFNWALKRLTINHEGSFGGLGINGFLDVRKNGMGIFRKRSWFKDDFKGMKERGRQFKGRWVEREKLENKLKPICWRAIVEGLIICPL